MPQHPFLRLAAVPYGVRVPRIWTAPVGGPPVPTAPIVDSFTRADENPLSGGGNWTTGGVGGTSTALKVVSNAVVRQSPLGGFARDGSRYTALTIPAGIDAEVGATYTQLSDNSEAILWLWSTTNNRGYGFRIADPSFGAVPFEIYSATGGSFPVVAQTSSWSRVAGDAYRLQIYGSTVNAWLLRGGTWSLILSAVDATWRDAWNPAITIAGNSETITAIWDDFAAAALPVPGQSAVSSLAVVAFEALAAVTATGLDPFDVQQTLAGATALFPLEEVQGIAATAASPVLMSGAVAAVAAFALDMVQQAAQTGLSPLDLAQGVAATTTSPVVMSGGVAATSAAAIEALQQIVQTGNSTIDDVQQALQTQQAPLEATGGITQTGSSPLDAGGGVAAASAFVIDMLKGVTQTGQMPVDMAALLAQAAAFALETQQAAAATGQVPVEVAQGLAQTAQEIIEAAKGVTSTGTSPLDEVGLAAVSATGIFPLDLVQAVTQTGTSSADTIQPVTTTGTSAIQTVQQASALAGVIVDAQQGLLRLVVLPASMLGGLAALAAMPIEEGQPAIIARPGSVTLTDAGGPILVLTDSMAGVLVVAELPAGSITTVEASVGSLTVTEPLAGAVTLTDGV